MAKFIIQCPKCGGYAQASNGFLKTGFGGTRKISCSCGYQINIRKDKITTRTCPNCKIPVVFDQSKGKDAVCPICKTKINTQDSVLHMVQFKCPSCSCALSADVDARETTCPLCDTVINVQQIVAANKSKAGDIPSVIQCMMSNTTFVKRHPIDNFVTGSKLIVNESQEAVFFKDGAALDSFGAGGHILTTEKLPLLNKVVSLVYSNGDPFRTEVYFVNKAELKGIKWGTPNRIGVKDPDYGLCFNIGASGSFNMVVTDARKFLIKNIGTTTEYKTNDVMDVNSAESQFRDLILNEIGNVLANTIIDNKIDILTIDKYKSDLADTIRKQVNIVLDDYGLNMPQFFINKVLLPEDDPNFKELCDKRAGGSLNLADATVAMTERDAKITRAVTVADEDFLKAQNEARKQGLMDQTKAEGIRVIGEAEAGVMKAKGYTYEQQTSREVKLEAMKNGLGGNGTSGSGTLSGLLEMGVGLGAMETVRDMTRSTLGMGTNVALGGTTSPIAPPVSPVASSAPTTSTNSWNCTCGAVNITSNFCPNCGSAQPVPIQAWDCPKCGRCGITSNFCPDCGTSMSEPIRAWDCPKCGHREVTSNFCPNCGTSMPAQIGNGSKFSQRRIITNFRPNSGDPQL